MNKLKIQDLERGKLYKFYCDESKIIIQYTVQYENFYFIDGQGNLYCTNYTKDKRYSLESILTYNEVKNGYFVEAKREIDWTKIPQGTKVQVRDYENEEWVNRYFNCYDTYSRHCLLGMCLDDNFTGYKMSKTWYQKCRIHPSVEIPEEWYKEEE